MAETEIKASTPIAGTNLAAAIVPFTTADTYPTHEARYGKGGYHSVQERADRDAIPKERREFGMLVYVWDDSTMYLLEDEKLGNEHWTALQFGASEEDLGKVLQDAKGYTDEEIERVSGLVQDAHDAAQAVDDKVKALGAVLSYKGAKPNKAGLPTTGNRQGDVWHVTEDSAEYVWNGTAWEALGTTVDLSGYATKQALDNVIQNTALRVHKHSISDIETLQTELSNRALLMHNHDSAYAAKSHTHSNYITQSDIQSIPTSVIEALK